VSFFLLLSSFFFLFMNAILMIAWIMVNQQWMFQWDCH
jgi:uncharacterized membrane protein